LTGLTTKVDHVRGETAVSKKAASSSHQAGKGAKAGKAVSKNGVTGRFKLVDTQGKAPTSSSPPRKGATVKTRALQTEKPGPSAAPGTIGRPGGVEDLPQRLKEYRTALVAELEKIVVPGVIGRLLDGASSVSPTELARRMLAVAPAPAPVSKMAEQVGPTFYDTAGVAVVLGGPGADPVSKQAVEQRRNRRTLLALQTSDGRWIYPTWQFHNHEVLPGLAEVLAVFAEHSTWSVGTWLTTPSTELDGMTAVQWLEAGADRTHLLSLSRHTAARWAA
jgi:hypothetical protein